MSAHSHDAYFKAMFADPHVAADAIRRVLAPKLADAIDWDLIERVPTDFVGDDLHNHRADLVLRVFLRGEPAFVYVLYEHQSSVDPMMPFRVLVYMVRLWQGWLRDMPDARQLPPIVPVVLYNGARPWSEPLGFHELFAVRAELFDALAPFVPAFRVLLDDLVRTDDDLIEASTRRALATVALLVLRHAPHDPDLPRFVQRLARHLIAAASEPGGVDVLVSTLYYLYEHTDLERGSIEHLVAPRVSPTVREAMMSTAQKLREEGREEATRVMLASMLRRRFGEAPAALVERIAATSPEARERWLDRLFVVTSLDELLDG